MNSLKNLQSQLVLKANFGSRIEVENEHFAICNTFPVQVASDYELNGAVEFYWKGQKLHQSFRCDFYRNGLAFEFEIFQTFKHFKWSTGQITFLIFIEL